MNRNFQSRRNKARKKKAKECQRTIEHYKWYNKYIMGTLERKREGREEIFEMIVMRIPQIFIRHQTTDSGKDKCNPPKKI
jgi:hypothetical protein